MANAVCSVVSEETNPMAAGPARMPRYPMVLTAETAALTGMTFCRPIREKKTGTMFALPMPMEKKPT